MKAVAFCAVKGGVGKTIISINVARKLRDMGYKVGFMDADLDNSNFAQMTGVNGKIEVMPDDTFRLYDWNGIKVFSMSLLVGREKSVSMTGDRFAQISNDALRRGDWGDIDIYIIDMPGGSSDIFQAYMTFFAANYAGSIIVTQPSTTDATRRVMNLHKYFEIPVLGIVENMSYFTCPHHPEPMVYYPFGESTADIIAQEFGAEVLGKLPLDPEMPKKIAEGKPYFEGEAEKVIEKICQKIIEAPVEGTGLLEKFKLKITKALADEVQKVMANLIVLSNKKFDIRRWASVTGFTQQIPFGVVVTDDTGTKALARVYLRLKPDEGRLVIIRNPEEVHVEAHMSFRTLARMIMGMRRRKDGKIESYDPEDAWLNGDLKVYGMAHTPKVIRLFRDVFGNRELMNAVRDEYEKLLERWI